MTGSSGFVGQSLIKYLGTQEFSLQSLSLRTIHPHLGDLKADVIVHMAGKAHDLRKVSVPSEYFDVNFSLTKTLYDNFLQSNARKFIFISSVKASADQVKDLLKETDVPNPTTLYGMSKLMAEEYIQSQPLPIGKSFYILRPCLIHGPGNKGNLTLLYKMISTGIPYFLAAFENKRSFLSVENLCFVIKELLQRDDIASGIYQVADDDALSTNELVKLIALSSGRKATLWKINPSIIKLIARVGSFLRLPLTGERLEKLTENYQVDNTKIRRALGKDLPVNVREGIIKTVRSFQNADKL